MAARPQRQANRALRSPLGSDKPHSDGYYVLEGTLTVTVDGQDRALGASDFELVPPGVVQRFANASGAPVRFLNIHAPSGGFAKFLRRWPTAIA